MAPKRPGESIRLCVELALLIAAPLVPWLPSRFEWIGWLAIVACALLSRGKPAIVDAKSVYGSCRVSDLHWTIGPLALIAINAAMIWSIYDSKLQNWEAPTAYAVAADALTIASLVIAGFGSAFLLIVFIKAATPWSKAVAIICIPALLACPVYAVTGILSSSAWNFGYVQVACTASNLFLTLLGISIIPLWEIRLISIHCRERRIVRCIRLSTIDDCNADYLWLPEEKSLLIADAAEFDWYLSRLDMNEFEFLKKPVYRLTLGFIPRSKKLKWTEHWDWLEVLWRKFGKPKSDISAASEEADCRRFFSIYLPYQIDSLDKLDSMRNHKEETLTSIATGKLDSSFYSVRIRPHAIAH